MKTFIISISTNTDSVQSTQQAIKSAQKVGYIEPIQIFDAILPHEWKSILPNDNNNFWHYPRPDSVGACFASHYLLWKTCIELDEPILILEHDAIFVDNIPNIDFEMCINFGRPSYIRPLHMKYEIPLDGKQQLQQINFLGHHAYAIKPAAATILCEDVHTRELKPNDIWLDTISYPWLEEYRPYPVWADTDFSTVQGHYDKKSTHVVEYDKVLHPDNLHYNYLKKYYMQCLTPQSSRCVTI